MKKNVAPLLLFSALLLLLGGCGSSDTHPVKGVVVEVYPEPPGLLVDHEEIPGFMAAMTMRFEVAAEVVGRVKAGDTITGRLRTQDKSWVLEDVRVVPKS